MRQGAGYVAIALALAVMSAAAEARISAEERASVEAFQAAVRGEREFGTDFMVKTPGADERVYLMNLVQCKAGGMEQGRDGSVRVTWSCDMEASASRNTSCCGWRAAGSRGSASSTASI